MCVQLCYITIQVVPTTNYARLCVLLIWTVQFVCSFMCTPNMTVQFVCSFMCTPVQYDCLICQLIPC